MAKWGHKQEIAGWILLLCPPILGLAAAILMPLYVSHPVLFWIAVVLLFAAGLVRILKKKR